MSNTTSGVARAGHCGPTLLKLLKQQSHAREI